MGPRPARWSTVAAAKLRRACEAQTTGAPNFSNYGMADAAHPPREWTAGEADPGLAHHAPRAAARATCINESRRTQQPRASSAARSRPRTERLVARARTTGCRATARGRGRLPWPARTPSRASCSRQMGSGDE